MVNTSPSNRACLEWNEELSLGRAEQSAPSGISKVMHSPWHECLCIGPITHFQLKYVFIFLAAAIPSGYLHRYNQF